MKLAEMLCSAGEEETLGESLDVIMNEVVTVVCAV